MTKLQTRISYVWLLLSRCRLHLRQIGHELFSQREETHGFSRTSTTRNFLSSVRLIAYRRYKWKREKRREKPIRDTITRYPRELEFENSIGVGGELVRATITARLNVPLLIKFLITSIKISMESETKGLIRIQSFRFTEFEILILSNLDNQLLQIYFNTFFSEQNYDKLNSTV